MWSRPWQVISWVTVAWSGRMFFWMKIADPPAFTLSSTKVPNIRKWVCCNWIACRNSFFPRVSWRQMMSFFWQKKLLFTEDLRLGSGTKKSSRIPWDASQASSRNVHTFVPGRLAPEHQVDEEHRVANADAEDYEENSQDNLCLHLHATVSAQAERVFLFESMGPAGQQVVGLKGEILWQTRPGSLKRSTCVNMDCHFPSQMTVSR